MENVGTIAITAVVTLVVTIVAGIALEFFKKIKPKLKYSVKESIPIDLDDKKIGANVVELSNPSSKAVKDIVLKIRARGVDIRNGGVKTTTGLDYEVAELDGVLEIKIPFLKYKDSLSITTILEDKFSIPNKPEITIRSPDNFKTIEESENSDSRNGFWKEFTFLPALVAATVVGLTLSLGTNPFSTSVRYEQGAILSLSAALVGLPELSKHYVSNDSIYYYNQGPFVYSLAKAENDKNLVAKYGDFLEKTIEESPRMAESSKAALYFFIAKIRLLHGDSSNAEKWFSKSAVEDQDEFLQLERFFKGESPNTYTTEACKETISY